MRHLFGVRNRAIPAGEPLYAVNPGYQPWLFYIHAPVRYVSRLDQMPAEARFMVVRPKFQREIETSARWARFQPRLIVRTASVRGRETLFYGLTPP